jgi:acyl-CoA thioesterase I
MSICAVPPTFVIPATLNVMPVGDSRTNGNGDTQAVNEGGYRLAVGTWMLTAPRGCSMTMIGPNNNGFANGQGAHDGITGVEISYHLASGTGNLPGLLAGSFPADLVLLDLGTNDINNGNDVATSLTRYGTLLAQIRGARAATRVLASTCYDGSDSTFHSGILSFNAGLPAVVAAENSAGGHVTLIDGYATMGAWNATDWFDGLHLNHIGYAKIAALFQTEIYNELARF